jgi:hypothetical protein
VAVCDLRMAGDVWRRNEGHGPAERAVLGYATGVTRGLAQRILFLPILLVTMFVPAVAHAVTYYVSKQGNDNNRCTSPDTGACLTIAGGASKMSGGDTLLIQGGTYEEQMIEESGFPWKRAADGTHTSVARYRPSKRTESFLGHLFPPKAPTSHPRLIPPRWEGHFPNDCITAPVPQEELPREAFHHREPVLPRSDAFFR